MTNPAPGNPTTFDWTRSAEEASGPKMPAGLHRVRVVRVQHINRDGVPLTSNSGDPQMRVVYQDAEAREVSDILTLSEKAGWTLARLMAAAGANLAAMTARGITPAHFADPDFAIKQLIGRELQVQVTYEVSKTNGKEYAVVTPIRSQGTTQAAPATSTSPGAAPGAAPAPAASTPPPSPATGAAPAAPSIPGVPTGVSDKNSAWAWVCQQWNTYTGADRDSRRAKAWIDAVTAASTLKPEAEFRAEDWTEVAAKACHHTA